MASVMRFAESQPKHRFNLQAMIRKLLREDREELKRILIDTKHFNDEEIRIALELIDECLNDTNQKDYNVFVYDDGRVGGYICFGKRPLTEGTYDLYWIAVDPEIHGKGIGSKLVRFMEDELRKMNGHLVLIETSGQESYKGERTFYERNGYMVQTTIKDFYRQEDDLVVFRKYL